MGPVLAASLATRACCQLLRLPGVRRLWTGLGLGSAAMRVGFDLWQRPHYAYGVFRAAELAGKLGLPGISVLELGVAGGNGLLALEKIAAALGREMGIAISVFGFDSGQGMPEPVDYRDLPYVWRGGFFAMDRCALEAQLTTATLVVGNIAQTLPAFVAPYPVGFIAFDLDYYSSTRQAFRVFEADHLPRVYCYFDDTIWPETACHNEYVGELCAIREFNLDHAPLKLAKIHGMRHTRLLPAPWNDQMYAFHDFQHPLYGVNITARGNQQLPLLAPAKRRLPAAVPPGSRLSPGKSLSGKLRIMF